MEDLQTKLKDFVASKKRISDAILSKFEYVEELKTMYSFTDKLPEMAFCLVNGIYDQPRCKCDKQTILKFINYSEGYIKYCGNMKNCSYHRECKSQTMSQYNSSLSAEDKSKKRDKKKKTLIEKYGVDNYFKLPEFIKDNHKEDLIQKRNENRQKSVQEKYGVSSVFKLDEVKEKIVQYNINNYGVTNKGKLKLSSIVREKLEDKEWLESITSDKSVYWVADYLGCESSTIMSYIDKHNIKYTPKNISTEEQKVKDILDKYNIEYTQSDNKIIGDKRHVDFYIESANLAIEVNGLYWHSEKRRPDKDYHQSKYDILNEKGIKLIQFWDYEINNKLDVVEDVIKRELRIIDVYNNQLDRSIISSKEALEFINTNSLHNIKINNIHKAYALKSGYDILSLATVFKVNSSQLIINSISNKIGFNVDNDFDTLVSFIISDNPDYEIITHTNCFRDPIYSLTNFDLAYVSDIKYWYTDNFVDVINGNNIEKSDIKNKLPLYEESLSVHQNMNNNGYYRVYGCKTKTWVYKGE